MLSQFFCISAKHYNNNLPICQQQLDHKLKPCSIGRINELKALTSGLQRTIKNWLSLE